MKTLIALWVLLLILASGQWAQARPGGGHSSSGHHSSSHSSSSHSSFSYHPSFSGHSGGGGGSSNPEAVLFMLVFIIIVVLVLVAIARQQQQNPTLTVKPTLINRSQQRDQLKSQLDLLRQSDPNFSTVLFTDFVHSLYNKFYGYSTQPEFSYLTPFLSTELQQHFQKASPWTVNEIVINGLRWEAVNTQGADTESISLVIDANYTLHQHDQATRYAVTERWLFYRQKGLLSPEPQKMQALCCPQCGAPAHFTDAGECGHCGSFINKGEMQWYLANRAVLRTTALAADDLVSYAEEQGTQLLTIKQSDLAGHMQQLVQRYGLPDWDSFWQSFSDTVVKAYFLSIYSQWSQGDWPAVRHLLSDRLYESNQFWLAMYAEHGWHNRLDSITISQIVPAKIEQDKFYEAITVRIFASCYDYTEDADGKVIGGSKRSLRRYSEYWTFVRRIGQEHHSAPYSLSSCPQCGAPADNMGQTGECGYCGSKISTGQFSWVLFLILQDDVYEG
jgi:hypothetical protein